MRTATYPAVDLSAIVQSVLREQGLGNRLLSISPDVRQDGVWLIRIQQSQPRSEIQLKMSCGPRSSPVDVRRSLKQRLGLE